MLGSQSNIENTQEYKNLMSFCEGEKIPLLVLKSLEEISMSNNKIFHMIGYFLLHHLKSKKIPLVNPPMKKIELEKKIHTEENQSRRRRKWSHL